MSIDPTTASARGADPWPMRLPFTAPPLLMNQLRSKTHWRQQHKAHGQVKAAVVALCRQHAVPRFTEPVSVELVWHAQHNRRRDPDSLAPMVKGCLDGLTEAGVLDDDSSLYVHDVCLHIEIGSKDPRVELTVAAAGYARGAT